jgi:GR25 family glycosyltransferase involved in LPS biosynthesis
MVFEDDVTFDDDFVPRFLKAAASLPEDWDLFVLNWYCTTESQWKVTVTNHSAGNATGTCCILLACGILPLKPVVWCVSDVATKGVVRGKLNRTEGGRGWIRAGAH